MPEKLNRHGDRQARELFDDDTAEVGSLGAIVDEHAGDAVRFGPPERPVGGADGGEPDFEAEMNQYDPPDDWESEDDEFPASADERGGGIGETDITGNALGIARGFGSHLPQDLGSDGFQVEEIPKQALGKNRKVRDGEELDDYDDDDPTNGKFDPRELEGLSIPGRPQD